MAIAEAVANWRSPAKPQHLPLRSRSLLFAFKKKTRLLCPRVLPHPAPVAVRFGKHGLNPSPPAQWTPVAPNSRADRTCPRAGVHPEQEIMTTAKEPNASGKSMQQQEQVMLLSGVCPRLGVRVRVRESGGIVSLE